MAAAMTALLQFPVHIPSAHRFFFIIPYPLSNVYTDSLGHLESGILYENSGDSTFSDSLTTEALSQNSSTSYERQRLSLYRFLGKRKKVCSKKQNITFYMRLNCELICLQTCEKLLRNHKTASQAFILNFVVQL